MTHKCAYKIFGSWTRLYPKNSSREPPEIKFRNFWCYQLKSEIELEKSSLPEMKNGSDIFVSDRRFNETTNHLRLSD